MKKNQRPLIIALVLVVLISVYLSFFRYSENKVSDAFFYGKTISFVDPVYSINNNIEIDNGQQESLYVNSKIIQVNKRQYEEQGGKKTSSIENKTRFIVGQEIFYKQTCQIPLLCWFVYGDTNKQPIYMLTSLSDHKQYFMDSFHFERANLTYY